MDERAVGMAIHAARKQSGMTQVELGKKLGVSGSMIGQWENNLRKPKSETIVRIAEALSDPPVRQADMVNSPPHYNQGKFECIEVMAETFGKEATKNFCLLNAFKYIWRAGEKNGSEDIKKAVWYLDKFLELEGETDE